MNVRCVFVGKLKEGFFKDAAAHYITKTGHMLKVEISELKDAPGKLPPGKRKAMESKAILDALSGKDFVIAMDERGRDLKSRELAKKLTAWIEDPGRTPCFVIGGAYGFDKSVRDRADLLLSLGKPTWPHELCRVMLLEQLYRAASINRGTPYHHD